MHNVHISKKSYKILCYAYHHDPARIEIIEKKFGSDSNNRIAHLCATKLCIIHKAYQSYTFDCSNLTSADSLKVTFLGESYIWERSTTSRNFWIPTFISIGALIVSIIAAVL